MTARIASHQPQPPLQKTTARADVKRGQPRRTDGHEAVPRLSHADVFGPDASPEKRRPQTFRFAPSPTGYVHIGNMAIAVANFLEAKSSGARFLLRIEDTNREKYKPEYLQAIFDTLAKLGIPFEGEPLFQSQRTAVYHDKVELLLRENKAYRDAAGAVKFRMPEPGSVVTVHDRVRGRVSSVVGEENDLSDFVIRRADGTYPFVFVNTVDDGESGVTHVVRGEDHLHNRMAARQVALFRALGYPVPQWFHLSLILNDQGLKLSKRDGATSVRDFLAEGFTPEVLVNHLARLTQALPNDDTLPVNQLAEQFDLSRASLKSPKLQRDALERRSKKALKAVPTETLRAELLERSPDLARLTPHQMDALIDGTRGRATTLVEIAEVAAFLLESAVYSPEDAAIHANGSRQAITQALYLRLVAIPEGDWSFQRLEQELRGFNEELGIAFDAYHAPVRWALTGVSDGLPLHHTMAVLGRDVTINRLVS